MNFLEGHPREIYAEGNFGLLHQLWLQHVENFPQFDYRFKKAIEECRLYGTGFARASFPIPEKWDHHPYPPHIMIGLSLVGGKIRAEAIPGVHDVTGKRDEEEKSPYANFKELLSSSFRGYDGTMNTFLLDSNPEARFSEVQYDPPVEGGKSSVGSLAHTQGDRYRLLLWSGFTENYEVGLAYKGYDQSGMRTKGSHGYATISRTPSDLIDRYIIISPNISPTEVAERVDFYRQDLKGVYSPNGIHILDGKMKRLAFLG